jgi:hypothetical protein
MNEQETVHRNRPFIFNAVSAFDVLLFSLFVQIGSGGEFSWRFSLSEFNASSSSAGVGGAVALKLGLSGRLLET